MPLSPAETRVLRLLAEGMTAPAIAARNRRSYETVREQRKRVLWKLGARNTPHAVAIAFREGLLL